MPLLRHILEQGYVFSCLTADVTEFLVVEVDDTNQQDSTVLWKQGPVSTNWLKATVYQAQP
jgi:hypothetical protein